MEGFKLCSVLYQICEGTHFEKRSFKSCLGLKLFIFIYILFKDRLRYCLIEDSLQFNIQFAMFLFNMYTAPTAHPSSFQLGFKNLKLFKKLIKILLELHVTKLLKFYYADFVTHM